MLSKECSYGNINAPKKRPDNKVADYKAKRDAANAASCNDCGREGHDERREGGVQLNEAIRWRDQGAGVGLDEAARNRTSRRQEQETRSVCDCLAKHVDVRPALKEGNV